MLTTAITSNTAENLSASAMQYILKWGFVCVGRTREHITKLKITPWENAISTGAFCCSFRLLGNYCKIKVCLLPG